MGFCEFNIASPTGHRTVGSCVWVTECYVIGLSLVPPFTFVVQTVLALLLVKRPICSNQACVVICYFNKSKHFHNIRLYSSGSVATM